MSNFIICSSTPRLRCSSFGLFAAIVAAFVCSFVVARPAAAQSSQFLPIGCFHNKTDNKIWLAAVGLTPNSLNQDFYDNPDFTVIMRTTPTGGVDQRQQKYDIDGKDVVVNMMSKFNYADAAKYKLMKYSLVVDYSASIPTDTRSKIVAVLDKFVSNLPFAIEGQIIRFSDKVEKFDFTTDKNLLKSQLNQSISYGMTSLHDALMEAANSLVSQGSGTPVRVVVLFTDGYDTSSSTYKDRASFISTFTTLVRNERIFVLAVGVSKEQDFELMNAITDKTRGVTGQFVKIDDFDMSKFDDAFRQIDQAIKNTVIFRFPKLGADKAKAEISLATKTKSGNFNTFHQFQCEY